MDKTNPMIRNSNRTLKVLQRAGIWWKAGAHSYGEWVCEELRGIFKYPETCFSRYREKISSIGLYLCRGETFTVS
jgi:hypothetical protein